MLNHTYPKEIYRALRTLDAHFKITDPHYYIAAILMASVTQGANVDLIAHYLDLALADVAEVAARLWKNKIWEGDKVTTEWATNPKHPDSGIGFWLDVSVGAGLLRRGRRADGETTYQMNESGVEYIETTVLPKLK